MAQNTRKFRRVATQLEVRIEQKVVQRVALDIHANVVQDTPIDTGWARSNWIPQVGAPFEGTVGTPTSLDSGADAPGLAAIARWKSGKGPIYITNNVPYISFLNRGSSVQAPAGFVEKAIQRAMRRIGSSL